MKNPIIRFGLIGGIVLVILGQLQWYIGYDKMSYNMAQVVGYLSIVLALTSIYFAVHKYREEIGGGFISFGKAFKIGALTTLIPSLFMFISTVFFYLTKGDEFKEWAMAEMAKTMSAEEFQAMTQQIEANRAIYENPYFQGVFMFLTVLVIGLIISLVVAFLLKNEKTTSPQAS